MDRDVYPMHAHTHTGFIRLPFRVDAYISFSQTIHRHNCIVWISLKTAARIMRQCVLVYCHLSCQEPTAALLNVSVLVCYVMFSTLHNDIHQQPFLISRQMLEKNYVLGTMFAKYIFDRKSIWTHVISCLTNTYEIR